MRVDPRQIVAIVTAQDLRGSPTRASARRARAHRGERKHVAALCLHDSRRAVGVESIARMYDPVIALPGDPTCAIVDGAAADADGDSIPADSVVTYDCLHASSRYRGPITGTSRFVDGAPETASWLFTATAETSASLTAPDGSMLTSTWTGEVAKTRQSWRSSTSPTATGLPDGG